MLKVQFSSADRSLTLRNKTKIKEFIEQLFKKEKKQLSSLHYIFCSDPYLLEINKQFLNHDYYTDIITFDLSEDAVKKGIEGEVYISLDRIKDNAKQENASYTEEALRVIFHGALHLCGYKDKKKSEIEVMRQKEEYYLQLFEKQ
ncbi:MAG: rRNA maturation RNase YbeY [Bacteroidota bacterium]|nr:rRNA maturation RNase YbeY [Bacteroidota bacterium]